MGIDGECDGFDRCCLLLRGGVESNPRKRIEDAAVGVSASRRVTSGTETTLRQALFVVSDELGDTSEVVVAGLCLHRRRRRRWGCRWGCGGGDGAASGRMAEWPTDRSSIGPIVARLRQLFLIVFLLSYHHLILPLEMKITIKTLQQKIFQVFCVQVTLWISGLSRNSD